VTHAQLQTPAPKLLRANNYNVVVFPACALLIRMLTVLLIRHQLALLVKSNALTVSAQLAVVFQVTQIALSTMDNRQMDALSPLRTDALSPVHAF